ncbi:MAG: nucleotidyltransferase domain-containing protein [Candidatus Hinthialibacter antarcticus]|nr:nucleotidyltransferase domain-containing protein [Candidatus Hinthialibacter antarcticus]
MNLTIDQDKIKHFCDKWHIKSLYLFGSVLRDDFHSDSDVDVLVKMRDYEGIGLYEWQDMTDELENLFGRPVDLVSADGVRNPFVRRAIAQNRRLIHASE